MVMLINSDVATLLFNHQKIGFIVTDSSWTIRQVGGDYALLLCGLEEGKR